MSLQSLAPDALGTTLARHLGAALAPQLYRTLESWPFEPELLQGLIRPGPEAGHTVRAIAVPLGADRIPGQWFEPTSPSGQTVLLLHGTMTQQIAPYAFYLRALLGKGVRVVTIELDGHGENPRPLAFPNIRESVPAALRYLLGAEGIDPSRIGVMGVSLGGVCALNALPAFPEVRAVALLGVPLRLQISLGGQFAELAGMLAPDAFWALADVSPRHLFAFLDETLRVPGAQPGEVERLHLFDPRTIDVIDRLILQLAPLEGLAAIGDRPCLIVRGAWDNLVPEWHARQYYERAQGPRAIETIAGRNHFTIMACPLAVKHCTDWFVEHL